jgi:hypothetical protein
VRGRELRLSEPNLPRSNYSDKIYLCGMIVIEVTGTGLHNVGYDRSLMGLDGEPHLPESLGVTVDT